MKLKFHNKLQNYIFSFILILISFSKLPAQSTAILKGRVIDKMTHKPLANTNIVIMNTNYGGASGEDGRFVVTHLPPGVYSVKAMRIDYEPKVLENIILLPTKSKEIIFEMTPHILELAPIKVEADRFSLKYQTEVSRIGFQQIEPRQIKQIAGALDDVTRAIQIFGSVMPASDYNSYFAVRGGSPEQNLVVMDGVIIPNPYRFRLLLGGGLSIFDPNTTEDVRLHIGGFSAEFGNFLSSVLEVDTREGNRHRICGRGSVNLIDASAVVEGPIVNGKGSWLVSGRRSYYDLLANRFARNNSTYPNTYDLNGKFVYNIGGRNKISLRTMLCAESTKMLSQLTGELNVSEDSKIQLTSLQWLSTPSDKLTQRATLSYYNEDFQFLLTKPEILGATSVYADLKSTMNRLTFQEDVIYEFSDIIWMMRGFYFSSMRSDIDFQMPQRTLAFARRDLPPPMLFNNSENYIAFYMDDIYKLKEFFHLKFGLRYDYSDLLQKSAVTPRLSLWYAMSPQLSLEGFWGMCTQNPNALSSFIRNQAVDLSSDIDKLEPEKVQHFSFGAVYKFSRNIHAKLELYYKVLDDLLFPISATNKKAANIGIGYARGIEFYIKKDATAHDILSGIFSYSYGISKYKEQVNNLWLPAYFDRRHSISVMANLKLAPNLTVNILWRGASGLPYNSSYGLLLTDGSSPNTFLEYDTFKKYFPAYQRLDIRLNYEHRRGQRSFSMYLDLTNVYNHKNVYDQTWQISRLEDLTQELHVIKMRTVYMLPIIPSFGLSVEF